MQVSGCCHSAGPVAWDRALMFFSLARELGQLLAMGFGYVSFV